jgi:hypothetical protein
MGVSRTRWRRAHPRGSVATPISKSPATYARIVDLRRDALARDASGELRASLASLDPGLDVLSLLDVRRRLLSEDRR